MAFVRIGRNRLEQDVAELGIKIAVRFDACARLAACRPVIARQHRIDHGAQRKHVGPRIRRLL